MGLNLDLQKYKKNAGFSHAKHTGENNYREHARPRMEELGLMEEEIGNWLDAGI